MNRPIRPVYEQPVYEIIIEVSDFSLDKAIPYCAPAIDEQIDCDDARDDFIKEKLHSNIRSSSINRQGYGNHCIRATWFGVAGFGVGSIAAMITVCGAESGSRFRTLATGVAG